MKTDYLWPMGFEVLNDLEKWSEGLPIISDLNKWRFIYNAIEKSDLTNTTNFPDFEQLTSINNPKNKSNPIIGLALLNFHGDHITSVDFQGILNGNNAPPYRPLKIFAGTVLNHSIYSRKVQIKWIPQNYFSNDNRPFSLEIDFSDGKGYQTIDTENEHSFDIVYDCIGEKNIIFKFTSSGKTLLSYSRLLVNTLEPINPSNLNSILVPDTLNHPGGGVYSPIDPGNLSKGQYAYHEGFDGKLNKPVIIAEGFDLLGNKDAIDLANEWRLMIQRLRLHGYDVYTLNFLETTQSVQKNAEVLIELIKKINREKEGNYEGVYLGISMGGIIGRIALKKMENEGIDHQIGLFVPFDSPFKGANVPVGAQWFISDIYNRFKKVFFITSFVDKFLDLFGLGVLPVYPDEIYDKLNSKVAQQLFVKHYRDSKEYLLLQDYLKNLGYPSKSRNVAFILGSDAGTLQGINMGSKLFGEAINLGIIKIGAECWYSVINKNNHKVSQLALPSPFKDVTRRENFDNKAYDNAPGGLQGGLGKRFCFVPSVSSIDLDQSIINSGNLAYYQNNKAPIVESGKTPFDNVYSNNQNDKHVNPDIFNWQNTLEKQEIMYDDMYLQSRTIKKNVDYEAEKTITLGKNVQPSTFKNHPKKGLHKLIKEGLFQILKGVSVKLEAGKSIEFKVGFEAQHGSELKAEIVENPVLNKTGTLVTQPPIIIGNNTICKDAIFKAISQNEGINDDFEWELKGDGVNFNDKGKEFKVPSGIQIGQYNLFCTSNGLRSSKIVIIAPDIYCN